MNMYLKNIVSSLANNYSHKQLWDKIFDAMDTGNIRREMILREAVDKKEVIKGYYYRDLPNSIKTMARELAHEYNPLRFMDGIGFNHERTVESVYQYEFKCIKAATDFEWTIKYDVPQSRVAFLYNSEDAVLAFNHNIYTMSVNPLRYGVKITENSVNQIYGIFDKHNSSTWNQEIFLKPEAKPIALIVFGEEQHVWAIGDRYSDDSTEAAKAFVNPIKAKRIYDWVELAKRENIPVTCVEDVRELGDLVGYTGPIYPFKN